MQNGVVAVKTRVCASCRNGHETVIRLSDLVQDKAHGPVDEDDDAQDCVVLIDLPDKKVDAIVPGTDEHTRLKLYMHDVCINTYRLRLQGYLGMKGYVAVALSGLPCLRELDLCSAYPVSNDMCKMIASATCTMARLHINCSQFKTFELVDEEGYVNSHKSITTQGIVNIMASRVSDMTNQLEELYLYNCDWMNINHLRRIGENRNNVKMVCVEGLSEESQDYIHANYIRLKKTLPRHRYANLFPIERGPDEWNMFVMLDESEPMSRLHSMLKTYKTGIESQDCVITLAGWGYTTAEDRNDDELATRFLQSVGLHNQQTADDINSQLDANATSPSAFFAALQYYWPLTP